VTASRSLGAGKLELIIESAAASHPAALADCSAVILSVNDGTGWREPARQLPAGWSLDTYRVKAQKPLAVTRGAGVLDDGRRRVYVHLAPAETDAKYKQRKAAWRKP